MIRPSGALRAVNAQDRGGSFVDNPVFNDASGVRVVALQWGSRVFLLLLVIFGVALALTLRTHVTVPGLDRLVPDARADRPPLPVRTSWPNAPVERPEVVQLGRVQPLPTDQPTVRGAGPPTTRAERAGQSTVRAAAPPTAPAERTGQPTVRGAAPPTAPAERTGQARPAARPAARPTAVARPTAAAAPTAVTTAPQAGPPTRVPSARPTTQPPSAAAQPTAKAVGKGTVKPRNPKAATPNPPGQSRTPKGEPPTDLG
jgi:hypothetical protein